MRFTRLGQALGMAALTMLVAGPASATYICSWDDDHDHGGLESSDYVVQGNAWDPTGAWRPASPVGPGGATWSVMGAGLAGGASDTHGGNLTTDLTSLYAGGVDEITTLGLALSVWDVASGFTNLGQVADGGGAIGSSTSGVIRIGAIYIDGSAGSNVLAHAFYPHPSAYGGDTHFDNSNAWSDGGGGGTFDFFTVALHEFGHALGLGHSTVSGSVMEAIYGGQRRTLSADDIAGIQAIYGPNTTPPPVPEPATLTLLGLGLAGLAYRRRQSA